MGLIDPGYNLRVLSSSDPDARKVIAKLSDYKQLRRKRYVDEVDRQLKEQRPMAPITLPQLHFMRDLGDKYVTLDRLLAHKHRVKEQKIETLERNRPKLEGILGDLMAGKYPGVVGYSYVQGTYCLVVNYIGCTVQWYAHLDEYYVQHGNEKRRKVACNALQLIIKLEHGRSAF